MKRGGPNRYWLRCGFAIAGAAALNLLPIDCIPGSRLLLGSYVAMPFVLALPFRWAWVAAAVPAAVTIPALGQPFFLFLAVAEATWLHWARRRWPGSNRLLLDVLFWFGIGLPVGYWLFTHFAGEPTDVAGFYVFKQFANQVTACAVACFVCRYTNLPRAFGGAAPLRPRLRTLVTHYVFLLALVPLSIAGVGLSFIVQQRLGDYDSEVIGETAVGIGRDLDRLLADHFEDVQAGADALQRWSGGVDASALLALIRRSHPGFAAMLATDQAGRVRGAAPSDHAAALAAYRVDAEDYFRVPARTRQPYVSAVFRDERAGTAPVVALSVPWFDAEARFAGVVTGVLSLEAAREILAHTRRLNGIEYLVAAPDGRVIAADSALGRAPLQTLRFDALAPLLKGDLATLHYDDAEGGGDRQRYLACVRRSPRFGFVVVGRRALLEPLRGVQWLNALMVAMIAGVALSGAGVVWAAQRRISRPLELFATGTEAQRGAGVQAMRPPSENLPDEVDRVFRSFNRLASELTASYTALQRSHEALDRRVAERTAELEQARADAEAANLSKTKFLAMTSHEIRTPMNAVIGLTQAMLDDAPDAAAGARLRTIHRAGVRLLNVVNDLLDWSQIESGKVQLLPRSVDLEQLCQEVCALFQLRAQQQGIRLTCALGPGLPASVEVDGPRLQQVLINLVGNAVKFTRDGSVRLSVDLTAGAGGRANLRFAVCDTGPGISAADRDKLFQPYVRLGESSSYGTGGTGLGLAISHRLVSLLGGALEMRSEPGQGSEFFFVLDLPCSVALRFAAPAAPPAPPTDLRPLRVLAADDDEGNREVFRAMLEGACDKLEVVASGEDALAALERETFDVALIDLEMPTMDGFAVATRCQGLRHETRVRLVAVSAHAKAELWARCADAGFDAYLEKPLSRTALVDVCVGQGYAPSRAPID